VCSSDLGKLDHLRFEEGVTALQFVDDAQRELVPQLSLAAGMAGGFGSLGGGGRVAAEDGGAGAFCPADVGFDLGEGGRDACGTAGGVLEVLDGAFTDVGEFCEGELREAAGFACRSDR